MRWRVRRGVCSGALMLFAEIFQYVGSISFRCMMSDDWINVLGGFILGMAI